MSYAVYNSQLPPRPRVPSTNVISAGSLVEQLSSIVHQVQSSTACCSSCECHPLTNGNKDIKELCRVLNGLFSVGLIKQSESYWPVVKEFISKSQIAEILSAWQPHTPKGRALAWLYQSLNDGTLEWQIRSFADNHSILDKYYRNTAFMADKQTLEMVSMYLRGLDGVRICLQPRNRKLSQSSADGCPRSARSTPQPQDCHGEHKKNVAQIDATDLSVSVSRPKKVRRSSGTSAGLFEQSVADFSGCPEVLGLSAIDSDLLLADAELCDDALEYAYPEIMQQPASSLHQRFYKRKTLGGVTKPSVPKIVETSHEAGLTSSMENSITDFSLPPADSFVKDVGTTSTPISQVDADAMFREIIRGRRQSPEGSATPPAVTVEPVTIKIQNGTPETFTPPTLKSEETSAKDPQLLDSAQPVQILRHRAECTATPPNTFVPSSSMYMPIPNGYHQKEQTEEQPSQQKKVTHQEQRNYSDFEQQIINRLENVLIHQSDSFSERGSNASVHSSMANEKTGNGDHTSEMINGVVETPADPQTALTQSGEILLESGEVLELTVHVMKEGEQFYKMFRVYTNHHLGNPLLRYLLLTNNTLYLLTDKGNKGDGDNSDAKYDVDFHVPYRKLEYVSVGLNGQMFTLNLRQPRQSIVVCTASDFYTRSIVSNMELAVRRAASHDKNLQPPSVLTDATPQRICINKWIMGEIGVEDNFIHCYSFVYWNPNISLRGGSPSGGPNRNGYLYMREYYPNGWLKKSTDWQQSYFILRGKKLYQFEDLSCKFGKRVFDLQEEILGCRQAETKEHTYCIELVVQDDSVLIQLACPTKHELQQWLHAFVASFSQAELAQVSCDCLACCAVVTDGYILLGQETTTMGFVRTLALARLEALSDLKRSKKFSSVLMTVPSSTVEMGEQWLLSFINVAEMEKFFNVLKSLLKLVQFEDLVDDCDGEHLIKECRQHWVNVKQA